MGNRADRGKAASGETWDAGDFPYVAKLIASAGELCVERAKLGRR